MDAMALLQSISEAYGRLRTLQIEAILSHEGKTEGFTERSEERLTASYAAPDKIRIEKGGRRGSITVFDGTDFHVYVAISNEYFKASSERLPGGFRPEFPVAGNEGPVLFGRIHEGVLEAVTAGQETLPIAGVEVACEVVRVTYPIPPNVGFIREILQSCSGLMRKRFSSCGSQERLRSSRREAAKAIPRRRLSLSPESP